MKRRTTPEIFWEKVAKADPSQCWLWVGASVDKGYGRVSWEGRSIGAHRLAWILTNGPIPQIADPNGAVIMHTCDNPPCCNPAHLKLGTIAENNADRERKGRSRYVTHPGETCPTHVLTERQVAGIIAITDRNKSAVAREYGVDPSTIYAIWAGKSWKHLPRPFAYQVAPPKISFSDIRAIATSTEKSPILAARYGVASSTIRKIKQGARHPLRDATP